ncbi:hypothetical protein [Sutterella megalosphaeroides]|uniref:Uncharacterized protein n=1 Tax=Sutterella megalosphaeroides TaxID=2494234 RepID=A0A2Z6IFJ8_9BURK|nr:hypothetical protein [Sutterella megalosphaeroides]BBF23496.1 hypothetical protein SUTMEG_13870 [Sutterella megalosphaeroides]
MTLAEHLRNFLWNDRIGFARWKVARELLKKRPDFFKKPSCGDLELLSEHIDGMPTGRTVFFPPSGVAGIVAGMDDKFGRDDSSDRLFPPISCRWKDEETPVTPEAIRAANLDRIRALGFVENGLITATPSIRGYVLMTFDDATGEQVLILVPIRVVLERLRMGEDYRNIPPVEGEHHLDWWAELRRRYPKETFWVPRQYRR